MGHKSNNIGVNQHQSLGALYIHAHEKAVHKELVSGKIIYMPDRQQYVLGGSEHTSVP